MLALSSRVGIRVMRIRIKIACIYTIHRWLQV
jgi:hypothetical protein